MNSNKLITEFMDNTIHGNTVYFAMLQECKVDELEYDISWDWLMPVISKIIKNESFIENEYRESIMDTVPYGLIEDTYKVVVEFIKWYNKNECLCKNPILQKDTKQCGKCKLYIDRVKHILLTQNIKE